MPNDIGSVSSITGTSTALNNQGGQGAQKPSAKGTSNPGDSKPPRKPEGPVPMPK
jgi:hypothetical protein